MKTDVIPAAIASDPETTNNVQDGPGRNALLAAIQSTRMPMILTDPHRYDNPIIFANRAFVELSGYSSEELIGRNCRFLQGEGTSTDTIAKIRQAVAERTTIAIDIVNYSKDGRRFVNELYVSPVFDSAGNLLYFFGSQVDITAYTEARLALQLTMIERERHVLSQIAEGVPLGQVLEDLLRLVEAQNGYGMRTSILFLSDDGKCLQHGAAPSLPVAYNQAIDGMVIGEGEGSCGTVASRGTPVYVMDIASDPLWINFRELALSHDLRACWSTPIKAARGDVLGTFAIYYDTPRAPTRDEIGAIGFVTQTAALAIERHRHDIAMQRSEEKLQEAYTAMQAANKQLLAVNDGLEKIVQDRTQALRLFGNIVQSDRAPILAYDRDLKVIGFNRAHSEAFQRVMGSDQQTGDLLLDIFPLDQRQTLRGLMERALAGETFSVIERFGDPDRERPTWEITYSPLQDEGGAVFGAFHVARDVSDRVRAQEALAGAEEALRQSQKMEAVGQLTGGLAHDFNNLLAGISGSLELMQLRMQQGRLTDVDRYMTAAQGGARRAAALTHRLLAFSRRQTLEPKPTDVDRLVMGMQEMIQRTVGPTILVEVVGATGIWPALVDPSQLENALLNLCINARDAMPNGGRMTIETANKWMDERGARQHDTPEGHYLSLSVTDTGTGMPPEVIERVFEPFFTTKPLGEGTGLGLSMIYGFAKQSGGQVRIFSEVGQGTTVSIYLPRHHGAVETDDVAEKAVDLPRSERGETVLVVDDEPTVRMLLADILDDLGYAAIEAGDSATGLRILQSDVRIDLLVTDVGLPGGMNGRQMADAGRAARPDLKVLFITGYAENAILGNGHLAPGMAVLTKPFAVDAMAARIRSMIESGKGAGAARLKS